jgi:hypothetical protein
VPRACLDVSDVLLVYGDVVAGAEPAQVAGDEVPPRVVQRGGRGGDVPGNVLGQVDAVERPRSFRAGPSEERGTGTYSGKIGDVMLSS